MKPDVREAPISIRVRKSQRDLIDMAASLVSKSLTDFMLEVACREAQNILLDRRLFLLNHNQFGVLGIFRPKTTKCSGGRAVRGLQRGITFR